MTVRLGGYLHRATAPLAGAPLAAIAAGFAWGLRAHPGQRVDLGWRLAGLLSVPGVALGLALVPIAALCTPGHVARIRAAVLSRPSVYASWSVVTPPAAVLWVALATRAGRYFLTAFHVAGLAALAQSVALLGLTVAVGGSTALCAWGLTRLLAPSPGRAPGTVSVSLPLVALAAGLSMATAWVAWGVHAGDIQGHGGGILGCFGVLKKPELDLTPVAMLTAIALGAMVLSALLNRVGAVAAVVALTAVGGLLRAEARDFARSPVATEIDARPGLPRTVLRALRRRYDRDHDGYSALFGGGDCDDRDPRRNPGAVDIPGNGVDEDCSGADAPRPPAPPPPPPSLHQRLLAETPEDLSLVIITVDTLRWDTHYAGNPYPITPNLDALAAQGVVFDHGYALSSYTGKAIGPLMIGRYATECWRDSEHFTRYLPQNVFLAERLHAAGFSTFGAASHFYFDRHSGLSQGMDVWDMSARPAGDLQETTAADDRVADRAIALLQRPEATAGRFFLWVHFFDPHKQYVDHPDLPLFGHGERARYDREVMSTDRAVGRVLAALAALPAGRRTLVVVTADHGEAFGEHGMGWHGVELWDELIRVPWIVRVPGIAPRHVTLPRSQIDLVPTLLDLLRLPAPPPAAPDALSGQTLEPDLLGADAPARPVYVELPEGPYNSLRRSVIDGGWKLTERGAGHFELYHLADDPGERTDLARSHPADLARLRSVMEQVRAGLHPVPALPRREDSGS